MPATIRTAAQKRKLLSAIAHNDMKSFSEALPHSLLNLSVLSDAIGYGRSEMLVKIAKEFKSSNTEMFLTDRPDFLGKKWQLNLLQFACTRCSVEAVSELAKTHVAMAKSSGEYDGADYTSVSQLLLAPGIKNQTQRCLLTYLLDIVDPTLLAAYSTLTDDNFTDDLQKTHEFLNEWNDIFLNPKYAHGRYDNSSDGSSSVESQELYRKEEFNLAWHGPVDMISYIISEIGDDIANESDSELVDFRSLCAHKSDNSDFKNVWKARVVDRLAGINTTVESFEIDQKTHRPIIRLKMYNKNGAAPIIVNLHYNVDGIAEHVKSVVERIQSKSGLARKQSLEKVRYEVTELKSQFAQTPTGMNNAVLQKLEDSLVDTEFYIKLRQRLTQELNRIMISGSDYFLKKNSTYQIAITAISLAGEANVPGANLAAAAAKSGLHALAMHHGNSQADAVFKLSSDMHPEQWLAISIAFSLTKLLNKNIDYCDSDAYVERTVKAFIEVMKNLKKSKLDKKSFVNDAEQFDNIANAVANKLAKGSSPSCSIC